MTAVARRLAATFAFLLVLAAPAFAEPDYPAFTGLVVDDAHVLSDADKASLTQELTTLQDKTGVQFAVATIGSLGGDEIEPYANALFRKWGIGQKGVDNGLLLLWAPNERKIRFEVGRGLEGTMTDLQSKLILHNTMVPKLTAGDGAGALKAGVDDAITVLTTDKANLPAHLKPQRDGVSSVFIALFILFIVVFILLTIRGRGLRVSSGFGPGVIIGSSSSRDWSSDDGGSFGGGDSFGGGGGGDSGGGGSSDSY